MTNTRSEQVEAFSNLDRLCDLARSCNQVSALDREIDSLEASLRAALEAKPAAEVTDEVLVRFAEAEQRVDEARKSRAYADEAVREALETARTVDCATHHQADLLNAALAAIEAALTRTEGFRRLVQKQGVELIDLQAENERLRRDIAIRKEWHEKMLREIDARDEMFNDPAFVRVPREVLKGEKMHNESAVGEYADALLREYGGTE